MHAGTIANSPTGKFTVSIIIDGKPQPLYRRHWDGKYFVVGNPGKEYTIQVHNTTYGRILALASVDGRDVFEQQEADLTSSNGIVISPNNDTRLAGWRLDDDRISKFAFGTAVRSVADKTTGSTDNTGVIGVAVYTEIPKPVFRGRAMRGESYGNEALRSPVTMGGSLGTHMGEVEYDRVGRTSFDRVESLTTEIVAIGYDTEAVLREQGIIAPAEPNPFPGRPTTTGYDALLRGSQT